MGFLKEENSFNYWPIILFMERKNNQILDIEG